MLTHVVRARRAILQSCAAIALVSCGADLGTAPAETSPGASQQEATFHPTANLTLAGGNYRWTDANIPAGVTVTVTGDVTINTAGAIIPSPKLPGARVCRPVSCGRGRGARAGAG